MFLEQNICRICAKKINILIIDIGYIYILIETQWTDIHFIDRFLFFLGEKKLYISNNLYSYTIIG